MFKEVALCLAVVAVSGCDINLSSLRPVKWATVDVNKVREVVKDVVAAENPYPAELEAVRNGEDEYMRIRNQVARLKSSASENCKKLHLPQSMIPQKPNVFLSSAEGDSYYIQQHRDRVEASGAYQKCLTAIDDDQLIADLNLKVQAHEKLRQARQVYERSVAQKTEIRAREIVASYGKANGFDLIVEENRSGVIYNESDMIVDVTGGVLESVQR
ncbi:OmpH family outer membrane protein [Pseudomonas sp. OTU750018]|uniref:OmpH family outer membrane protein n=1 Tax=Pseudomonas sp. OTU750018 TaxID=2709708 RepID=UPI00142286AF|nr:OmpH family outer membrane protein [Pseudomonas sp. OTU750018]